jgi:hypothetical protein
MQVVSGRTRTTLTSHAVEATASYLGSDQKLASQIGTAVDIGVPFIAGFARAIAIRRGGISLVPEEAVGGHTIARHVGRTEAQLRLRLANQPKIPAATTFKTLKDAERCVAEAIKANKSAIKEWAKTANIGQAKGFPYDAGRIIGEGVIRSTGQMQEMSKMVIVLRKVKEQNRIYFVLTAYPKP